MTVRIAYTPTPLHGLIGTLSHSRERSVWMSPAMHQRVWQSGHVAIFTRFGGVPPYVRLLNLRTAVGSGAGPSAVLTPAFARFATTCGFGVDPCRAAKASDNSKPVRNVRTARRDFADLFVCDWPDLQQLRSALNERSAECHATRRCPITGTLIVDAHAVERPLTTLRELFDCAVARHVSRDCFVSFEGRRYSVLFAWIGRTIDVRGAEPSTSTLDPIAAKLVALGLECAASDLPVLVDQAAREDLSPLAFLDLLLSGQLERKDERRVTTTLKLSGLPPGKTLEAF